MAANEKDIAEFEDMFDLSSDKSDDENEQTEEYGHSTESSDSFDDLAKEVSADIEKSDDKGMSIKESPHDIIKDVCSAPVEKEVEIVDEDDFFDNLPIVEKVKVQERPSDEELRKVVSQEKVNIIPETESLNKNMSIDDCFDKIGHPSVDYSLTYGGVGDGDDKIEWSLTSPASMYNSFYVKKRDLLFKYMVGGQIEYKRWTQELEEAQVTIYGEVFDHQLIIDQMEKVQQHRERVKAIHVRVNNQYFTFKRFVEMMRGFLARIEYLKPVLKQEGLIMEHMRDVELYYARLEALHDSATKTEKTLAAAFDTLSRKCTICMELKPAERMEMKTSSDSSYTPSASYTPPIKERTSNLDEFDNLPLNAQAAPVGHKIGAIGWGDV